MPTRRTAPYAGRRAGNRSGGRRCCHRASAGREAPATARSPGRRNGGTSAAPNPAAPDRSDLLVAHADGVLGVTDLEVELAPVEGRTVLHAPDRATLEAAHEQECVVLIAEAATKAGQVRARGQHALHPSAGPLEEIGLVGSVQEVAARLRSPLLPGGLGPWVLPARLLDVCVQQAASEAVVDPRLDPHDAGAVGHLVPHHQRNVGAAEGSPSLVRIAACRRRRAYQRPRPSPPARRWHCSATRRSPRRHRAERAGRRAFG